MAGGVRLAADGGRVALPSPCGQTGGQGARWSQAWPGRCLQALTCPPVSLPALVNQVVFNDKVPVFQKFNASNTRCVWWMRTVG